jgi:hypothetical protein
LANFWGDDSVDGSRILLAVGLVALCGLVGCGGSAKEQAEETSSLKPLVIFYGQFTGQHQGRPPADEAEFKAYIKTLDPSALKSFNITDAESLFVSPRDKKPYVILYGGANGPPGPGGQPVVAYEQEGVMGKRYVASNLGAVEEVDDKRFRELVPSAK